MGGGLMQLVAYGAQDIYLTGNPQITFFKVVYRRHTNFSMESIKQTLNGSSSAVTTGSTATCTISRNGDLVYKTYVTFTAVTTNTTGSKLITDVELEIGGQRIDRHYQEWNDIWNELSTPESKAVGLKAMQLEIGDGNTTGVTEVQVPLNFWFCRNPGLALPLIALQYHEVKLKFTWGDVQGNDPSPQVWCDYIYLDTDERRRFAQVSHEYLIEQVQRQALDTTSSIKLNFNHPVKELIWTSPASGYTTAKLILNGHDRFAEQKKEYFQLRQPFDYHTAVPKQNWPTAAQLSTLDRQTHFVGIHEATAGDVALSVVLTADGPDESSNANTFKYYAATGILLIQAAGNAATPPAGSAGDNTGYLYKGDQIAIVCTAGGGGEGATVGRVYFATLTADSAEGTGAGGGGNGDALALPITLPTSDGSGADSTTFDGTPTTGSSTFIVFKVTNGNSSQARTSKMTNKINVYSFALKPEEHQPSGTCNFSRIDNAKLEVASSNMTASNMMYAVNYNVLRIMSGMGGLAYSN
jgi:hypothetical protein